MIGFLTRGSGRLCLEQRSYHRCCWRTELARNQASWAVERPLALALGPCSPACLSFLPLSKPGHTVPQVLQHMFPVRHELLGCWAAEATGEAGIDDSGPTLLSGGHHQKEADFARVRSEVTEGVPPRRSWQLRHRHGNGNGILGQPSRVASNTTVCTWPAWQMCGAKLSGVHGSLGPRGAKGGPEACACSAAFRVLLSGSPALFFSASILRTS